jgi:hypothetical protein
MHKRLQSAALGKITPDAENGTPKRKCRRPGGFNKDS